MFAGIVYCSPGCMMISCAIVHGIRTRDLGGTATAAEVGDAVAKAVPR